MKRKKTDTVQLSKIRLREELRQRLAKDAERAAKSLNAEIVDRLEASYTNDERIEELRSERAEFRKDMEEARRQQNELLKQIETIEADHRKDLAQWERLKGANALLNGLLGENKLKAEALRLFALSIAQIPDEEFVAATVFGTGVISEKLTTELKALAGGPHEGARPRAG